MTSGSSVRSTFRGGTGRRLACVFCAAALAAAAVVAAVVPATARAEQPADDLVHAQALSKAFRRAAEITTPAVVVVRSTLKPQKGSGRGPKRGEAENPLKGTPFEDMFPDGLPEGFEFNMPEGGRAPGRSGVGSGVIVDAAGVVITNNHVVEGADEVIVELADGREFKAATIETDPESDLAVVKLADAKDLPTAKLGNSDKLEIGDWVIAIGNPFELETTVSAGIISGKGRELGGVRRAQFLQTDAAINPGNSGGPLITMNGDVVGINGQIATRFGLRSNTGLGFAISAKQAKLWLPRFLEAGGGEVKHGRIPGLAFEEKQEGTAVRVLIRDVADGSAAATAGFRPGDVVVGLDDAPIPSLVRLASVIGMYPEGHEVKVAVKRGGEQLQLPARLVAPKRCAIGANFERPRGDDLDVVVSNVEEGTPAATAGLKEGDQVLEINGQRIQLRNKNEFKAFDRMLRMGFNEGDVLAVKVRRSEEGKDAVELDLRLIGK